jgi:hypothetical protein
MMPVPSTATVVPCSGVISLIAFSFQVVSSLAAALVSGHHKVLVIRRFTRRHTRLARPDHHRGGSAVVHEPGHARRQHRENAGGGQSGVIPGQMRRRPPGDVLGQADGAGHRAQDRHADRHAELASSVEQGRGGAGGERARGQHPARPDPRVQPTGNLGAEHDAERLGEGGQPGVQRSKPEPEQQHRRRAGRIRNPISSQKLSASPHSAEASVKMARAARNSRLVPKRSPS